MFCVVPAIYHSFPTLLLQIRAGEGEKWASRNEEATIPTSKLLPAKILLLLKRYDSLKEEYTKLSNDYLKIPNTVTTYASFRDAVVGH